MRPEVEKLKTWQKIAVAIPETKSFHLEALSIKIWMYVEFHMTEFAKINIDQTKLLSDLIAQLRSMKTLNFEQLKDVIYQTLGLCISILREDI